MHPWNLIRFGPAEGSDLKLEDSIRFSLAHSHWALLSLIDAARDLSTEQLELDLNIGPGGVRTNIAHTIECMFFFADNFAGRDYAEPTDFQSLSSTLGGLRALLARAQRNLESALLAFAQLPADHVFWPNADAGSIPAATALAQVFDHAALHRAQCIHLLKRHGALPPPDLDPLTFASTGQPWKDSSS
jgi:uncharacterized damage-inducible protein DinB